MKRLIDIITIYRFILNPARVVNPRYTINYLINNKHEFIKHSLTSKLTLTLLKKLRSQNPYVLIDFSKAKKLYTDYFNMDNHIESLNQVESLLSSGEVYVTRFRDEIPIKGKRYCEYYINCSYGTFNTVYRINKKVLDSFTLTGLSSTILNLSTYNFTQFRYSTEEEIENYKRIEVLINQNKKKIEVLTKEINWLSKVNSEIIDI